MRDATLPRGVRMEAFEELLSRACADQRQMLFGVDESHLALVAFARDSIARYPSERLYVDAAEASISGDDPPPDRYRVGVSMRMARLIDGVVGGRRFENCVMRSQLTWH